MVEYYKEKGYEAEIGKILDVKGEDLTPSSHEKIVYICDYCGKEFSRIVYSNERSKKNGNTKDACKECSRTKRAKETCLINYGVDNPMKKEEFYEKNREGVQRSLENSIVKTCTIFEKGIPVSKGQLNLANILEGFELNYKYDRYYIDLVKDNIAIEYDGKGHDLEVRMGKKSLEDFNQKEKIKTFKILENFRLLRIIDKKDKFRNNITKEQEKEIKDFINGDKAYKEIIIS